MAPSLIRTAPFFLLWSQLLCQLLNFFKVCINRGVGYINAECTVWYMGALQDTGGNLVANMRIEMMAVKIVVQIQRDFIGIHEIIDSAKYGSNVTQPAFVIIQLPFLYQRLEQTGGNRCCG
ncbi:hypothetical protein A3781_10050 [Bacillus badius]|nr:hypothetical protein A3781_10050 [Bacillus badius]